MRFVQSLEAREKMGPNQLQNFTQLNPNYWKAYYLAGRYYYAREDLITAGIFKWLRSKKLPPKQNPKNWQNILKNQNVKPNDS